MVEADWKRTRREHEGGGARGGAMGTSPHSTRPCAGYAAVCRRQEPSTRSRAKRINFKQALESMPGLVERSMHAAVARPLYTTHTPK